MSFSLLGDSIWFYLFIYFFVLFCFFGSLFCTLVCSFCSPVFLCAASYSPAVFFQSTCHAHLHLYLCLYSQLQPLHSWASVLLVLQFSLFQQTSITVSHTMSCSPLFRLFCPQVKCCSHSLVPHVINVYKINISCQKYFIVFIGLLKGHRHHEPPNSQRWHLQTANPHNTNHSVCHLPCDSSVKRTPLHRAISHRMWASAHLSWLQQQTTVR